MRGAGDKSCSVRAHLFECFYSRFAPDFAPDSRSNSISLNHTHSGRIAHGFNASIVHSLSLHLTLPLSPLIALSGRCCPPITVAIYRNL